MSMVTAFYEGKRLRAEADERDRQAQEAKQFRAASAGIEPVQKDPGDGTGPSAVMVGTQAFAPDGSQGRNEATGEIVAPGAAQAAADAYNKPEAKIARQMGVLMDQGKTGDAMALEKASTDMAAYRRRVADSIQAEGINHFVDNNLGKAPSVSDIESGKASTFDLDGVDDFNKTGGKVSIPAGSKGQWKVLSFDNGRKVADFQVVDASGQPLTTMSARTLQAIHQQSLSEREKTADTQFKEGQDIALKKDELAARSEYWNGMVKASQERADKAGGGKASGLFERMDEADKIRLSGLKDRATRLEAAMATAQANGTWNPNDAGTKQLLMQQADIEQQMDGILSAYSTKGSRGSQTDLGLFGDNSEPSFNVTRDPAAFRSKLVAGKADAKTLQAFDAKYPQAQKSTTQARPIASAGVLPTSGPTSNVQALREAQAAANAYRPPVDLRAKVAGQGVGTKFTDEDLGILNLINGRK